MESTDKIIKVLRKNLAEYMASRPNLSVRSIAKLSGCNRYFLSKIVSEVDDIKSYDFSQVLLLMKYLNEKDSIKETIDASDSSIRDALMAVFSSTCESSSAKKKVHQIPDEVLIDFGNFMILSLAAAENMTIGTFSKCIPDIWAHKIDRLISMNLIEICGGVVKLTGDGQLFNCPYQLLELHIPEIIKRYFSHENTGKRRCSLGHYFQNVNREGWNKIHDLHQSFMRECSDLLMDEQFYGNIPVFSINVLDTYLGCSEIEKLDPVENKENE